MRFNARELSQLAIQPPKHFTKEGSLFIKEASSGLMNDFFGRKKSDSYSERWCRLRSNLLFYFKGKDMLSEPSGVILLERCTVMEVEGETQSYTFVIAFPGDEKVQYLAAHTSEQRDEWMAALQQATYEGLRSQLIYLRTVLIAKTGRDPMSEDQMQQVDNMSGSDISSEYHPEEPVLEMSIACRNLPNNQDGRPPTTFVAISIMTPPQHTAWIRYSQTEIIQESNNPRYLTIVSFHNPRDITMITRFKGTVYVVKDRAHGKMSIIGQVVCTLREIVSSAENKLTLRLLSNTNVEDQLGTVTLLLWELPKQRQHVSSSSSPHQKTQSYDVDSGPGIKRASGVRQDFQPQATIKHRNNSITRDPFLKRAFVNAVTKSYRRAVADDEALCVQEIMTECVLSFHVPQQMLKLYIEEEKQKNIQLCRLGELDQQYETMRKEILDERISNMDQYLEAIDTLKNHKGPQFKKSVDKADKSTEFVALNLHLQRMRVTRPPSRAEDFYDFITIGAFTAHSLKFKSGGLRRMLYEQSKGKDGVGRSSPTMPIALLEIEMLERNLKSLKTKTEWYASQIKSFTQAQLRQSQQDTSKFYASTVVEFLSLCETPLLGEAATALLREETNLQEAIHTDRPTQSQVNQYMEDTRKELNKLNELAESSSTEERGWQTDIHQTVVSINSQIDKLYQHVSNCLAFILIKEGHEQRSMLSTLQYRRDIVLSQAVTGAIAGFYTILSTHGKDLRFLHQISKIGLLLEFESLLSTYGDENGMLEDMVVGVEDLNNVTFKLVLASQVESLPVITGTRSHIVVDIPVSQSILSKFPHELQRGQHIKICPVLFSMGINEQATLAEKFGHTLLQEQINRDNLVLIRSYWEKFTKLSQRRSTVEVPRTDSLEVLVTRLQEAVYNKKPKNVDILQLAAEVCIQMNGVRYTSCKSAKDRTSMSCTLEQCMILQRQYGLDARTFGHLLDTMRSEGTRRINTMKNLGIRKYAFNGFQIVALPKLYRPPDGTYGKTQT
ncbi:inositol polyphosphate-4-phosphatase type I A-like [Glandiceps talaboti]